MNSQERGSSRTPALACYLATAILAGLGLVGKSPLLAKLGHLPHALALLIALLFPLAPILWLAGLKYRRLLGLATLVLLAAVFLTVLRTGALHKLGRGSDQGDCVIVAAQGMAHGQWPYVAANMPTKNAMSCGPGWVALQVPAIRVGGYFLDQLLLWAVAIFVLFRCLPAGAVTGMLTLLGLSAGTWLSAADGNDFLPFGLLLATVYVVLAQRDRLKLGPLALGCISLVLICLAQFRVPTIFLPLFFLRPLGLAAAVRTFLLAVACQTAFLLWDTQRFVTQGPMHVGMKLFRTGIGQSRALVSAEFLIPVILGALCVVLLTQRVRNTAWLLLAYLGLLFVLPAIQNLYIHLHGKGDLVGALGFWEGGNWIIGLLPLAAIQLVFLYDTKAPKPQEAHAEPLLPGMKPATASL